MGFYRRKAALFYVLRKLIYYTSIVIVASTLFFFILRLMPGDPVSRYVTFMLQTSHSISGLEKSIVEKYMQIFGLDKNLQTQYFLWMGEVLLRLNFGPSIINFPTPAQELVIRALPWTIGLLITSTLISWVIGIFLGTISGWLRGTKFDNVILVYGLVFSQIPYYVLALILVLTFGYGLGWFPVGGMIISPALTLEFIILLVQYSTLPALSLIIINSCYWAISSRALTIIVLGEDYLRFAEAKGLSKSRLVIRYIMRNTLLPQITGLAMSLGGVVGGMYFVESIFNYPGMGRLFMDAVRFLDYNLIQCITFVSISSVIIANLIVELVYPLIDPRVIQK